MDDPRTTSEGIALYNVLLLGNHYSEGISEQHLVSLGFPPEHAEKLCPLINASRKGFEDETQYLLKVYSDLAAKSPETLQVVKNWYIQRYSS